MSPKRVFIAIEGLSGVGKSTIARALAERIGGLYYRTPPSMFGPIRESVETNACPLSQHLYFCAGMVQASLEIDAALKERAVVCDKYFATLRAYSRGLGFAGLERLSEGATKADYTFLIQVSEETRRRRIAARGPITARHQEFLRIETSLEIDRHYRHLGLVAIDNSADDINLALAAVYQHLERSAPAVGR